MKYYILIQSINDVITNSSTEILTLKTDYTEDVLKEILLNHAFLYDSSENPCSEDVEVSKVDVREKAKNLYGDSLNQEELDKLEIILCKRCEIDPSMWNNGELYVVNINKGFDRTIEFMKKSLGAT